MSHMKLSVSVPDDVWATVWTEGASPSHLVQEGLRLVAARRRDGSGQLLPGAEGTFFAVGEGGDELLEENLTRLTQEADEMERLGYQVGVEAAQRLHWSPLDRLNDVQTLARRLQEAWILGADEGDLLGEQFFGLVGDYSPEYLVDEGTGEPLSCPTFFMGAATGCLEVRDKVRQLRLARDVDSSSASKSEAD